MPPAALPQTTVCRTRAGRIYAAPTTRLRWNAAVVAHGSGGINPSPTNISPERTPLCLNKSLSTSLSASLKAARQNSSRKRWRTPTSLLLVCEEGEVEYDPSKFAFGGVHVAQIEDKSELTQENLTALEKKSGCGRVIIEYNGMWLVQELYDAMPDNWLVYQCLATADGTTIKTYAGDSAMRSLLLDKIRGSELLVVNRAEAVNDDESRQLIHKLVRQASRRCDIAYEFKDGSVAYDDIPDPLPFDIDAPVIEIPEEFFGVWYMDCMDDPKKYDGKTVKYLAQVCQTPQAGKGAFVPGRFAMTCCVQDIQFVGMPCKYDDYKKLEQRSWINITAKVNVKYHPIYKGQTPDSTGPVLTAVTVEPGEKPAQDVVMFS